MRQENLEFSLVLTQIGNGEKLNQQKHLVIINNYVDVY